MDAKLLILWLAGLIDWNDERQKTWAADYREKNLRR